MNIYWEHLGARSCATSFGLLLPLQFRNELLFLKMSKSSSWILKKKKLQEYYKAKKRIKLPALACSI